MNRRAFLRTTAGTVAAVGAGASLYSVTIGRHDVDWHHVPLKLGLTQPLRVAVLGDIHFDPLYEEDYVAGVVRLVTAAQLDLVLFTGDFLTETIDRLGDLTKILSGTKSRLGSFACLGNHDTAINAGAISAALDGVGIRVLRNESVPIPGEPGLYVSGIESSWNGRPDFASIQHTPPDARHLLLAHEPDPFADLNESRVVLQLSGHSHGGQVRLPGWGALLLPHLGQNFPMGLYTRHGQRLYVNRGVGTLFPHCRFDCSPEVTILELS